MIVLMHILIAAISLALLLGHLDRLFFKENGSFSPSHIIPNWEKLHPPTSSHPHEAPPTESYKYLTKGLEAFVFVSSQGDHVIKFPRLPRSARKYHWRNRTSEAKKIDRYLASIQSIYLEIGSLTGLEGVHLAPSSLPFSISVDDRLGRTHKLPGHQLPFYTQIWADPYFPTFASSSPKEKQALIQKTIGLYSSLYDRGFVDRDPIFEKNLGVAKGEPLILDIGGITKGKLGPKKVSLEEMTLSLKSYLQDRAPEFLPVYIHAIDSACK